MSKKLVSVCSLLVVTALTGTVLADTKNWTNTNPANDSWCEPGNWNPSGVPGPGDFAIIGPDSPSRGPIIDCDVTVDSIQGPDPCAPNTQVVDVCDANLTAGTWRWDLGAGTATINVTGSSNVTIGGDSWRGCEEGLGTLNISGNPTIVVAGSVRGADRAGSWHLNMSGGRLEALQLTIGDNGGGTINLSGGTIFLGEDLELGGFRGSDPITVNVTGGVMRIAEQFQLPSNENRAGVVRVNLYGGLIDCNEFVHGSVIEGGWTGTDDWRLDIEQGELRIKGDVRDEIDANVAAGQITAYEREGVVKVELVDGNTVVTTIAPDPNRALEPRPGDLSVNVDPNALLTWKPAVNAATHHIYLGTDFDDVNTADTTSSLYMTSKPVDQNSYDPNGPGPLSLLTTYYWRIDEANGASLWKGRTWEFTTRGVIIDSNMLVWYKFDEVSGIVAADSSGYGNHGPITVEDLAPAKWEPEGGQDGGALRYEGDTAVQVPSSVLSNIGTGVTFAVWLKDSYKSGDDNWVFDTGAGGQYGPYHAQVADGQNPQALRGWHMWTFAKDEAADEMKIYFDGEPVASKTGVLDTLANLRNTPFRIGGGTWENYSYVGTIDDFRVFDYALSDLKVAELYRGGGLGNAWAPKPFNRAQNVVRDVTLEWSAGSFAVTHDVFFGTSFDDVNDATTSTAVIYKGSKSLGDESYEPGILILTQEYFWRVDEVNTADVNSPWKGNVWSFTVGSFLVVEDMEDYDDDASMPENPINETWIDGWWNNTGSTVYLEYGSGATVHSGAKSMWLEYDNNYGEPVENYSEIYANTATGDKNLGCGRDWTEVGVKALALFFYGDPDNDVEPLYVVLEDTSGANSVSNYGDLGQELSDITVAEWRQWDIALQDFNDGGVNIKDVNKVYIGLGDRDNPVAGGTGVLYIDDIRLYLPRCVPHLAKPGVDLSNNCIVDLVEIRLMAAEWLKSDTDLGAVTAPNAPVLHYKFDEPNGTTIYDYSGKNYHGTFFTDMNRVPTEISGRIEPGWDGTSFHFSARIQYLT
jgi:hypothetical protein